jgi:hypothetical protein
VDKQNLMTIIVMAFTLFDVVIITIALTTILGDINHSENMWDSKDLVGGLKQLIMLSRVIVT